MRQPHELLRCWIERSGHYTQSALAARLDVSRAAVSKWCSGEMSPSRERAEELERLSGGAVPAHLWPRRGRTEPSSPGARRLQAMVNERGVSIFRFANESGFDPRAFYRWATSEHTPRQSGVEALNEHFGLNLKREDFEVRA